jgi:hypothetical protein
MKDEVKSLWPEWELADAELEAWMSKLGGFSYQTAKRAVQSYYATRDGSFKRPKLYAILAKARSYQEAESPGQAKEPIDLRADVFVQCIEHENPTRLYTFEGVYVVPTSKQDDREYVLSCAEEKCRNFQQTYGGIWAVVENTDKLQMNRQLREHRESQRQEKKASEKEKSP